MRLDLEALEGPTMAPEIEEALNSLQTGHARRTKEGEDRKWSTLCSIPNATCSKSA
jgi:hypothetical protein